MGVRKRETRDLGILMKVKEVVTCVKEWRVGDLYVRGGDLGEREG